MPAVKTVGHFFGSLPETSLSMYGIRIMVPVNNYYEPKKPLFSPFTSLTSTDPS